MYIKAEPRRILVRTRKAVAGFPTKLPHGPILEKQGNDQRHKEADGLVQQVRCGLQVEGQEAQQQLDNLHAVMMGELEVELNHLAGHTEKEAKKHAVQGHRSAHGLGRSWEARRQRQTKNGSGGQSMEASKWVAGLLHEGHEGVHERSGKMGRHELRPRAAELVHSISSHLTRMGGLRHVVGAHPHQWTRVGVLERSRTRVRG